MDIKDFILIGGGLLIAAVVAHGFWIAWRARHDPLKIDLVTNLPDGDDVDDLKRLRAELPNGGARVVATRGTPTQQDLDLDREAAESRQLFEPTLPPAPRPENPAPAAEAAPAAHQEAPAAHHERAAAHQERAAAHQEAPAAESALEEPAAEGPPASERGPEPDAAPARSPAAQRPIKTEPRLGPAAAQAPSRRPPREVAAEAGSRVRDKVKDVILTEPKGDEPREPKRWPARKAAPERRTAERGAGRSARGGQKPAEPRKAEQPVEELIMINVLSPKGRPFVGGGLVEALRARGLRYGDMNIFHRVDPVTRSTHYSVASVVEPGTFDMADLDNFRSPGVCFFMQLPGPEQPLEVFEDMLKVARDVAMRVGGELKDEQRSVMTGQTVEHYRARISEFCRRRMSMRA